MDIENERSNERIKRNTRIRMSEGGTSNHVKGQMYKPAMQE